MGIGLEGIKGDRGDKGSPGPPGRACDGTALKSNTTVIGEPGPSGEKGQKV